MKIQYDLLMNLKFHILFLLSFPMMQFVNFTEIMSKDIALARKEAEFALHALMEIPSQYKATIALNLLGYSLSSFTSK